MAIAFPDIDPVALQLGPVGIRWYALAYLAGFVLGWQLVMKLARQNSGPPQPKDFDDFLVWAVIGTVLGGRLGYVLFYQPAHYLGAPWEALQIWHGGMSFHGGMLGVLLATVLFTRLRKIPFLAFADLIACVAPIGLFFGRLANFVNDELYGRVTSVPWAVLFPRGGFLPRHPSQLYEAALEGAVLLGLLLLCAQQPWVRQRPGLLLGLFMTGYAAFRSFVELFREPDAQIGLLFGAFTMGQLLSLPMLLGGVSLVLWVMRRKTT